MRQKILFIGFFILLVPFLLTQEKKEYTLHEIIDLGIKNNPTLSAWQREIAARQAAFEAAKRLRNPELELQKGRARSHDGFAQRDTGGVAVSQTLENPFARRSRLQLFEKEWEAAEHMYDYARLEMTAALKTLFCRILYLENKQTLVQDNLVSIQEIHRLIDKRARLGEVKELDAIKLYVETLKAQNELNKVLAEVRLAKENLNKFLANVLPADFSLVGELEYAPLELKEEALVAKTLLSYPMIKKKEKDIESAESHLSWVKWQRLPDFKLSGFIHEELDGRDTGVGISLSIPLWNFKSKEISQAEQLVWKQKDEFEALQMELSTEVKAKLNQLRLSEQTITLFHGGLLAQAEASLKLADVSYRQGEISLIDYLDSQRTYFSVLKDYQEALYAWNADKAALEKAIGEELQ